MFPGETVTFTCRVDIASGWEFLWYHNENEIAASNTDTYMIKAITLSNSGQYHCKAKRGPFYTEKSDPMSLQVSGKHTFVLCHQLSQATSQAQDQFIDIYVWYLNEADRWSS